MSAALEAIGLGKRFGRTLALDRVNLTLESGSATALLGPNGAGKTTLMRLCATLLRPTSGSVRLFGLDARAEGAAVRRRIGFLAHESLLYPELTPTENLLFYARLFRRPEPARRAARLIERLGLAGWAHRPVRTLSRGLVQRCALARVFIHEPGLLFFDEPFTGLDADARDTLIATLGEAHRNGATLVMSTHDLSAACALCTSAVIIVGGRLAWRGPIAADAQSELELRYHALTHGARPDSRDELPSPRPSPLASRP
jgi:heme exporter protein A